MEQILSQSEIRAAIVAGQSSLSGRSGKQSAGVKTSYDQEELLQRACHTWNLLQVARFPNLEWIFHCPNGGKRSRSEAGRLKQMGVKAGVPDFTLPFHSAYRPGLAIELKSPVGSLSDDQRKWLQRAQQDGWVVGVARTLDQYIDLVHCYHDGSEFRGFTGYVEIFKMKKEKGKNV